MIKPVLIFLIVAAAMAAWSTDPSASSSIRDDPQRDADDASEAQHPLRLACFSTPCCSELFRWLLVLWVCRASTNHAAALEQRDRVIACLAVFSVAALVYSKAYTTAIRTHRDLVKTPTPSL